MGDWARDDASTPRIGQYQHSHPRHDAELGDLLPIHVLRTLVVGLDAGGLVTLYVYCSLLALGQHQRIPRPANPHPTGRGIVRKL